MAGTTRRFALACILVCSMSGLIGYQISAGAAQSAAQFEAWNGVLDQHPSIQYAIRPVADRATRLNEALAAKTVSLQRDARTGYLSSLLDALHIAPESQMLVFSKTGVQRAQVSPSNPRAIYFDESVAVGYVPGAPLIEIAAHDPQQGVNFYTLDQSNPVPQLARRTACLTCHVSATTLDVPGVIARSHIVGEDGNTIPQEGSNDVDHRTPHPDRWGGWFVTFEGGPPPYSQRAHAGNITFSPGGITSNQIFIDWIRSAPESRYPSAASDITALLVFDHQMRAINLLTRLNWEARVAASAGGSPLTDAVRERANELADYLLFAGEMPPSAPLTAPPAFAKYLATKAPKDRTGRSCAQLDLVSRLMRYPCSYMIYSDAFVALPAPIKQAVYERMAGVLTETAAPPPRLRMSADDRRAVLDILRDTRTDFPGATSR